MKGFLARRLAWSVGAIILAGFLALALTVNATSREARHRRHDICVQVEQLKAAQRAQARANFAKLDLNLRLLHIKKTPAIVEAAQQNRDEVLHRFAPSTCPD